VRFAHLLISAAVPHTDILHS